MIGKRLVAILAIGAMLGIGTLKPTPARADTTETIIIAAGALVAYVIIVVIATKLVFGHNDMDMATIEDPTLTYQQPDGNVHFTQRCRQDGGTITLACW